MSIKFIIQLKTFVLQAEANENQGLATGARAVFKTQKRETKDRCFECDDYGHFERDPKKLKFINNKTRKNSNYNNAKNQKWDKQNQPKQQDRKVYANSASASEVKGKTFSLKRCGSDARIKTRQRI